VVRFHRWAQAGWAVSVSCFWTSPLLAEPSLHQECKELSAEDSARVEARLLARLLTQQTDDVNVSIICDGGIAVVSASVGTPEVRRSVALSGTIGLEAILALADRALAQLLLSADPSVGGTVAPTPSAPRAEPHDTATLNAAAVAPPPAASSPSQVTQSSPNAAAAAPTQAKVACSVRASHDSRVRVDLALETWGSHAAGAAALGLEQQAGRWLYAFVAGFARPFQQPSLSQVTEWTSAAEVGWQGRDELGLRVSGRLGFSLLTVNPDEGVVASSGTVKPAGFLSLDLSRPIWLGRFGLAPGVGVRVFSAKRALTIEGQPELQLSTPSLHAFITMLFRASE